MWQLYDKKAVNTDGLLVECFKEIIEMLRRSAQPLAVHREVAFSHRLFLKNALYMLYTVVTGDMNARILHIYLCMSLTFIQDRVFILGEPILARVRLLYDGTYN